MRMRDKGLRSAAVISLLVLCAWCAAFFPRSAFAAGKTIGVIMTGDISYYRDVHSAFTSRLAREGHAARVVEIIMQKPFPDPISLSNAARKLIALDADVIVAYGAPAAIAAHMEKTRIPIVYAGVYEPLASKIKAKNITGISSKVSVSSLLRYLRGIKPITNLGVIYSANEEDSLYQMKELQNLSQQHGFRVQEINLKRPQDAKAALSGKGIDAIFVTSSAIAGMAWPAIMEHSREHRAPTASMVMEKSSHAIITLSSNPKEQGEKAADMVMKILVGVSAERIRAESSSDVELIFNLKEAISMGYRIPMDLVTEATRLIQ